MSNSDKIVLNVGGVIYNTSRRTLTMYPKTMLGRMFAPENSHLLRPQQDGSYFFDRDGKLFRHVLNFYRNNTCYLPTDSNKKTLLHKEYEYFGISFHVRQTLKEIYDCRMAQLELSFDNANCSVGKCVDIILSTTAFACFQTILAECMKRNTKTDSDSLLIQMTINSDHLHVYVSTGFQVQDFSWKIPATQFYRYTVDDNNDRVLNFAFNAKSKFFSAITTKCSGKGLSRICVTGENVVVQHARQLCEKEDISSIQEVLCERAELENQFDQFQSRVPQSLQDARPAANGLLYDVCMALDPRSMYRLLNCDAYNPYTFGWRREMHVSFSMYDAHIDNNYFDVCLSIFDPSTKKISTLRNFSVQKCDPNADICAANVCRNNDDDNDDDNNDDKEDDNEDKSNACAITEPPKKRPKAPTIPTHVSTLTEKSLCAKVVFKYEKLYKFVSACRLFQKVHVCITNDTKATLFVQTKRCGKFSQTFLNKSEN